ncbi:hypothetical protein EJ03DRAFT_113161 [Teratosphaeria nubilosa]|uniref:Uncharacterized protein n=1 Tax=Teratosphaeria nubilosa TaxID=161662 RepID=A0A6G1L8A9_9PEZI|nr:hypothetical protein EJ03DRAFT_113161 [Teratosphaeria nubilosa]
MVPDSFQHVSGGSTGHLTSLDTAVPVSEAQEWEAQRRRGITHGGSSGTDENQIDANSMMSSYRCPFITRALKFPCYTFEYFSHSVDSADSAASIRCFECIQPQFPSFQLCTFVNEANALRNTRFKPLWDWVKVRRGDAGAIVVVLVVRG